jgi:integrase
LPPPDASDTATDAALVPVNPAAQALQWQREYTDMLENSRAKSTRRVYRSHWRHFEQFCEPHGREALPATSETVIAYVLDCAGKCSTSTLSARLAAIAERHTGYANPCADQRVRELLKGVRREHGRPPAAKEPTLSEDIRAMVDAQPDTLAGSRNKAILLFGYASAMRRAEIVALDPEHLKFTREGLTATITRSKTDQMGEGQTVAIPYVNSAYCPVLALRKWLDAAHIKSGLVFRGIRRGEHLGPRLSSESVANIVKAAVEAVARMRRYSPLTR